MRRDLVLGPPRELGTVAVVPGLCGAYAAVLIMTSVFLVTTANESGAAVAVFLGVVASVFIGIAVYVATIVIVNGVDTVLAGRLPQIALLRLLGARARSLRWAVMRGATQTGVLGALVGTVVGTVVADVFRVVLVARGTMPDSGTRWPARCFSSRSRRWRRRVRSRDGSGPAHPAGLAGGGDVRHRRDRAPAAAYVGVRAVLAVLMIGGGAALLALAMAVAEGGTEVGFLVAFAGSVVAGTGLLVGARFVIPWLVGSVSRLFGTGPVARVAGRNAVLDPLRTTRSTMGLVVGVTLVTTFASGLGPAAVGRLVGPLGGAGEADPADPVDHDRGDDRDRGDLGGDLGGRLREHHVAHGHPAAP